MTHVNISITKTLRHKQNTKNAYQVPSHSGIRIQHHLGLANATDKTSEIKVEFLNAK